MFPVTLINILVRPGGKLRKGYELVTRPAAAAAQLCRRHALHGEVCTVG